jgi:hypothetical protein
MALAGLPFRDPPRRLPVRRACKAPAVPRDRRGFFVFRDRALESGGKLPHLTGQSSIQQVRP